MNYKKQDVIENLELLYLITLIYYPRQQCGNIPKIICEILDMSDEETQTEILINCKLKEPKLINEGLIRKGFFDDVEKYYLPHYVLTPKGFSKILQTDPDIEPLNTLIQAFSQYNKNNKTA